VLRSGNAWRHEHCRQADAAPLAEVFANRNRRDGVLPKINAAGLLIADCAGRRSGREM